MWVGGVGRVSVQGRTDMRMYCARRVHKLGWSVYRMFLDTGAVNTRLNASSDDTEKTRSTCTPRRSACAGEGVAKRMVKRWGER